VNWNESKSGGKLIRLCFVCGADINTCVGHPRCYRIYRFEIRTGTAAILEIVHQR
jgi:hypothetical protein